MSDQPLEEWQAWARRPIPPDVLDLYEAFRAKHGLGF